MKVSFFTTWGERCGIADYSRNLKQALEKLGTEVEVVPAKAGGKLSLLRGLGRRMNKARLAHIQHEYGFFGRGFLRWAVNYYLFSRQIKVPVVVTLHELMAPLQGGRLYRLRRFIMSLVQRRLFSRAVLVMVHTEGHRRALIGMGLEPDRVVVLPMPVPPAVNRMGEGDAFRRSLGAGGRKVLTIFGFVVERKGYEVALSAIKDMEGCLLLIAGGQHPGDRSGYFPMLKKRVMEEGLEGKVAVSGYIPDERVGEVMGATDIVLAPFLDSAGSSSLSHTVAYHKPIIASDIEPMRDLRDSGLEMELFRSGESGDLRAKIIGLINDGVRRAQMEECAARCAERFSYGNSALRIRRLYERLVS